MDQQWLVVRCGGPELMESHSLLSHYNTSDISTYTPALPLTPQTPFQKPAAQSPVVSMNPCYYIMLHVVSPHVHTTPPYRVRVCYAIAQLLRFTFALAFVLSCRFEPIPAC